MGVGLVLGDLLYTGTGVHVVVLYLTQPQAIKRGKGLIPWNPVIRS